MPTLILKFKENNIGEFELKQGESMIIGRREDSGILIENLAVSGHHSKIDSIDGKYLLTDLKSKNGTFVNDNQVSSHWLEHGDVITIGKHTLLFNHPEGKKVKKDKIMDQTMVMGTDMQKKVLPEHETGDIPVLVYLSGGEGEIKLSRKLTKIGKADFSDIVVSGLMVGQTAATISKRPNGYYLSYVGGMAKLKHNGQVVKESAQLKEFDTIEIGSAKLQFIYSK